jgi:hypothetical protein
MKVHVEIHVNGTNCKFCPGVYLEAETPDTWSLYTLKLPHQQQKYLTVNGITTVQLQELNFHYTISELRSIENQHNTYSVNTEQHDIKGIKL